MKPRFRHIEIDPKGGLIYVDKHNSRRREETVYLNEAEKEYIQNQPFNQYDRNLSQNIRKLIRDHHEQQKKIRELRQAYRELEKRSLVYWDGFGDPTLDQVFNTGPIQRPRFLEDEEQQAENPRPTVTHTVTHTTE